MTSNRVLAALTLLAVSLLLAALGLSSIGLRLPALAWPAAGLPTIDLSSIGWSATGGTGAMNIARDQPTAGQFALGFAAGWGLRWLYGLPWAALPHAVVVWLMGWRRSMAMLTVAIGCTAVLLLY